jgi:hypothetical protein
MVDRDLKVALQALQPERLGGLRHGHNAWDSVAKRQAKTNAYARLTAGHEHCDELTGTSRPQKNVFDGRTNVKEAS